MGHPLFGLFAEPATTLLVTTDPSNVSTIDTARKSKFMTASIGTTGGDRLEITVDGDLFISAPLSDLRKPWASALEAILHDEVTA